MEGGGGGSEMMSYLVEKVSKYKHFVW